MPKFLVLIIANIAVMVFLYISGTIASATFNPFEWNEGTRTLISIVYAFVSLCANGIIGIEYKPEQK